MNFHEVPTPETGPVKFLTNFGKIGVGFIRNRPAGSAYEILVIKFLVTSQAGRPHLAACFVTDEKFYY